MYELGIIGGMGPEASALLYNKIISYTVADTDQEHIKMCVLSCTDTPDRTQCILLDSDAPVRYLNDSIHEMDLLGVKNFLIACNTSHYYINKLQIPEHMNFINIVKLAVDFTVQHFPKKKVFIIGTKGTVTGKVYDTYFSHYSEAEIRWMYPEYELQEEIMSIITDIKGNREKQMILNRLCKCFQKISRKENDVVFLLACTELSIFYEDLCTWFSCVDALQIAAAAAISCCGRRLNPTLCNLDYKNYDQEVINA